MSHTVSSKMQPGVLVTISDAEYERWLELGIVYEGMPIPPTISVLDTQVAELVDRQESATRAELRALMGADAGGLNDGVVSTLVTGPSTTATTLRAALVPKWKPNTTYAQGEPVVNPSGQLVTANAAFTSGASYVAGNWTISGSTTDASLLTSGTLAVARIADGSLTAAKLAADVATQAELDAASTADRARANHTGTQTSASISDLTEAVQDIVGAFFGAGTGASVTYNDAANTITVSATGTTDPEAVRDAIGAAMVGVGNISVTVNDALDTITIATTATVNSTDAALRDRSTHTGTQAASTITGLAAVATTGAKADVGLGSVDNTSDASKPVSTAQQTALDAKLGRVLTKRAITAAYTLVVADAVDMVLHATSGSALTITLPQDTAVTIAQEIGIPWRQYGAGQITFAAGTGATLISRGSAFKAAGQYAEGLLTKVAANTWLLSGDIVP